MLIEEKNSEVKRGAKQGFYILWTVETLRWGSAKIVLSALERDKLC